jgi:CheY-like chemotaxis protein
MILVVDDDPLVQRTCQLCLEPLGYDVAFASNGAQALDKIANSPISVVVIDIFMPEMDGIEALLALRKKNSTLPVIAMSGGGARARFDFLAAAMKFGADQVIKKPFAAKELIAALNKYH